VSGSSTKIAEGQRSGVLTSAREGWARANVKAFGSATRRRTWRRRSSRGDRVGVTV